MSQSAEKEAVFAIQDGLVDQNEIPCITVVADGCWSKRSYKTNYNALCGAGAIVGKKFGDVLYISVKNRYCSVCSTGQTKNKSI